jgi:uncharacterized membrane protein (UPF0127 family)
VPGKRTSWTRHTFSALHIAGDKLGQVRGSLSVNYSVKHYSLYRKILALLKYCTLLPLAQLNPLHACPVENEHITITFNGHALTAEVASNLTSHMCGLAFRHELPPDHGMLFAYADDQIIGFWMKNTFIHLSIAFLDADGKILEIHDMDPHEPTRTYISKSPARYALEVNQGWYSENGIDPGDSAVLDLHAGPEIFRYARGQEPE